MTFTVRQNVIELITTSVFFAKGKYNLHSSSENTIVQTGAQISRKATILIRCKNHYITVPFSRYKMGNKGSTQNIQPKDLKDLKKSTKFTEKELKDWYKDFLKVVPNLFTCKNQFFSYSVMGITCRIISHRLSRTVLYLRENFKKFTLNSFRTVMQTRY